MYPSYPSYEPHTSLAIRFAVPAQRVVERILRDSENLENLQLLAAANVLFPQIKSLARLMSRHRIQLQEIKPNELGITLFLPPPPCPPPKSARFVHFIRRKMHKPSLDTIVEESPIDSLKCDKAMDVTDDWVTLYEYLPFKRRSVSRQSRTAR
ncbi:hypothetical protein T440DRAFT_479967 [Plenodomus tracheiphilus IPT5]|uniref:Uncharacterized protein n=1 Tax=Plenodomus tracheiphilus IPT5 TaxID=1408161 RepID=A0A6A7B4Q5_9PLEO|nr:hypothetical protein T440DRAFT_479967 [Plenodomus tracheiphilus IPT5]